MDREVTLDLVVNSMDYSDNSTESKFLASNNNEHFSCIRVSEGDNDVFEEKPSKHTSRKQSKRRRKSSNHNRPLPRIIVKPLPPPPPETREWTATAAYADVNTAANQPSTMREVLASIPGFCIKPRKRSSKKLSTAAQLQQTKEGCIDLETPDSILVNTNIRALLNKHTFSLLPPLYQYKLGQLLPSVDRPSSSGRLSSSSLNNEFFARACLEWQDSLSGGEFTPENQQKMKTEAEREKSKIDPWKLKHFEPIWGEKFRKEKPSIGLTSERPSLKTTIKLRPTASITSSSTVPKIKKSKSSSSSKRLRSVGAVTRSSTKVEEPLEEIVPVAAKSSAPVPDLLPLKHVKSHNRGYIECAVDFNFSDASTGPRVDESVSNTPIDPLLLHEGDTETSDVKEDLDIRVVTIEETSASKETEEENVNNDYCCHEGNKRLSDDSEETIYAKRIRFEECNVSPVNETENFVSHSMFESISNNSDNETACATLTQQAGGLKIYSEREDIVDTNSEDSKTTPCYYEYDDHNSVSPASSIKNDKETYCGSVDNVILEQSSTIENTVSEELVIHYEDDNNKQDDVIVKETCYNNRDHVSMDDSQNDEQDIKVDPQEEESRPLDSSKAEIVFEDIEVSEGDGHVSHSDATPVYQNTEEENSTEDNLKTDNNIVVQNYYDDHFKDAESLIMETGEMPMLTPRKL